MQFYKRDWIGMDAGARAIKLLRLRRTGWSVQVMDTASLQRDPDPDRCVQALRTLLEERKWTGLPCLFSLRADLLSTRILDLPDNGTVNLRRLAATHIEEFEVLAGTSAVTEYVVTRTGGQRRLLLVTARVDTIMQELQLPRQAGLAVKDIVPGPLACYQGLQHMLPRSGAPGVCLDIGHESTEWIIGQGRGLLHLRRLPIGSRLLEEEAAQDLPDPLTARPIFRQWLDDLHAALRAYSIQYDAALYRPDHLVFAGRHQPSPEQQSAVGEKLDLDIVEAAHPQIDEPAAYATALGLALSGIGRKRIHISLLPPLMKSQGEERRQFGYWAAACVSVVLSMLLLAFSAQREVFRKQHALEAQQALVDELSRMEEERFRQEERNERLRRQLQPLRIAVRNNQAVRAVLGAVEEARDPDDWFVLIADAGSYFNQFEEFVGTREEGAVRQRGAGNESFFIQKIILEGYTPRDDLSTVRAIVEHLRQQPFVEDADLLADDKVRAEWEAPSDLMAGSVRRFALEIILEEGLR